MALKDRLYNRNYPKPIETCLCSICFSPLTNAKIDISTTRCNHTFCTSCIIKSMKVNNTCPLCRTELTSPNRKFTIKFNRSKRIVLEEIQYYNAYITDHIEYLMNSIEYHTNEKTLQPGIKDTLHKEMLQVFENFGMGICLNINGKYANFNVYNTGSPLQPDSPIESPPPQLTNSIEQESEAILSGAISTNAVNQSVHLPPL